jgi:hypothetical protein
MKLRNILYIVLAAIATPFSNAQGEGEWSLRFLAFPQQDDSKPIQLLVGDGKTIAIETPGHTLSPTYRVKPLTSIVVGVTENNKLQVPVFKVLGKAPSLATSKQIILLMRKGTSNSDGFVVLPIDGDLAKFSGASFLFINASNMQVGGKIGDKIFQLKPGQKELLKPAATHAGGCCQVTLAYQNNEKWQTFVDTRWSASNGRRSLVFFYQDPETGDLGVAPIIESVSK